MYSLECCRWSEDSIDVIIIHELDRPDIPVLKQPLNAHRRLLSLTPSRARSRALSVVIETRGCSACLFRQAWFHRAFVFLLSSKLCVLCQRCNGGTAVSQNIQICCE